MIKKKYLNILVSLLWCSCFFAFLFIKQKNEIDHLQFTAVDMTQIADGTYCGEEQTTLVKAAVTVTVKRPPNQNITLIEHDNGLGPKAEKIVKTMINNNTYDVDAVSSATISSQVIKGSQRRSGSPQLVKKNRRTGCPH